MLVNSSDKLRQNEFVASSQTTLDPISPTKLGRSNKVILNSSDNLPGLRQSPTQDKYALNNSAYGLNS